MKLDTYASHKLHIVKEFGPRTSRYEGPKQEKRSNAEILQSELGVVQRDFEVCIR